MKRSRVACKGRARPTVAADMERVLVALCFVLVLKPIAAVRALILLFGFMSTQLFMRFKLLRLLGTTFTYVGPWDLRCGAASAFLRPRILPLEQASLKRLNRIAQLLLLRVWLPLPLLSRY